MKQYAVHAKTGNCYDCGQNPPTQILIWETIDTIPPGLKMDLQEPHSQGYCDACMDKQLKALLTLPSARLLKVVDLAIGEEEGEDWS